jgi:nucleolar complex protein 3
MHGLPSDAQVLLTMAADCDATVCQLAAASAMVVFKDLAPGYRIRPPTEKELEVAVSKEVKAVRDFEAAFLKGAPNEPSAPSKC